MIPLRKYVSQADVQNYSNITINDSDEANDIIDLAESIIDNYVGYVKPHVIHRIHGKATGGTTLKLIDTSGDSYLGSNDDGYYRNCVLEMMSGTQAGKRRAITDSDQGDKSVTVEDEFSSAIADGDAYVIYQLAKFPRAKDVELIDNEYYKIIPEQIKQATLAQIEYIVEKGLDFFSEGVDYKSESFSKYSYTMKDGADRYLSPLARRIIRRSGLMVKRGVMTAD